MTKNLSDRIREKFKNVILKRSDLHPYQADIAIPFLMKTPFSALFIDMGLGKTVSSLTVIVDLLESFTYDKVLVIGPMRVATQTWPNEIGEWAHTAHLNYTVLHIPDDHPEVIACYKAAERKARQNGANGAEARAIAGRASTLEKQRLRVAAVASTASVHIIPADWVEWLVEHFQDKWPYRMVIIDESSQFKDWKSNRFKALAKVRNHPGLIERLHLLTATPAAESYMNLFAQMYLLDGGERFGKGITRFQAKYFTENKYSRKLKLRPDAEEEILAKIADICLVMKADDYIKLDKPNILRRPVRMSPRARELYDQMATDFIVELDDGTLVEAETAAALSAKLLQMASGVLYETYLVEDAETDDMKKVKKVHHIHDEKIDELREIVEEADGEPILVSYHWKSSLARLRKEFPHAVVMDSEGKCVKAWNARKIKMLLMHPQSGGHGLNLQKGGHLLVIYDMFHSLELFLQLVGRLARQGQKHAVTVWMLTTLDTIDEAVCEALRAKEDAQDRMFAMLKRLIRASRKKPAKTPALEFADDEL